MAAKKKTNTECCTTEQMVSAQYIDRVLPDQKNQAGKVLSTNGTSLEWKFVTASGAIDLIPVSGSPNAISSGGMFTALAGKVDAIAGKGLSTNDYTTADKSKLAALSTAPPAPVIATLPPIYINNVNGLQAALDSKQAVGSYALSIHKHPLADIVGVQITSPSADQVLKFNGTNWVNAANTSNDTHTNRAILDATTASYTTADQTKLSGIAVGANNYIHPATHVATMIVQDATHRFVTDSEKATWNANVSGASLDQIPTDNSMVGVTSNGVFDALALKVDKVAGKDLSTNDYSTADKTKLSGIATGATANSTDTQILAQAAAAAATASKAASTITGLSPVAVSGSYNDLSAKPTIPAQFSPIAGTNMSITGTYPNLTFTSTASGGSSSSTVVLDNLTTTTTGAALDAHQGFVLKGLIDGHTTALANKVDVVAGKGLSSNDYTSAEKTKLQGIQAGATANSTDAALLTQAANSAATAQKAATTITEDATHRFISDAERNAWNSKQAAGDYATNTTVATKIGSTGSPIAINNVWVGSQAQYDAIASPSASILYFIQ